MSRVHLYNDPDNPSDACPDPHGSPLVPDSLCYRNSACAPLCQARVSVLDCGFVMGDGVYEQLPAHGGACGWPASGPRRTAPPRAPH